MRSTPLRALLLAAPILFASCTVVDVQSSDHRAEIRSRGLIDGFASVGFAEDPSFLKVEVLGGRSPGACARVDVWHLARVEVGLAGAALGVGPFDLGIGTMFYRPRSPARPWTWPEPVATCEPGCESGCAPTCEHAGADTNCVDGAGGAAPASAR